MQKLALSLLLVSGLAVSQPSVSFWDGDTLRKICESERDECRAYILGAIDGLEAAQAQARKRTYCPIPAQMRASQLIETVRRYLMANPLSWHEPAATIVERALRAVSSC